ncbi:kinesin light chain [Anabrus simplex]|uniref:kinesin light chain n=1 Tax=Anabrus simplex TaxID=316456 RepID=UPI0035A36D4E
MPVSTLGELVRWEKQSLEARLQQLHTQIAELRANESEQNMAAMTNLAAEEGEVQAKLKQLTDEDALISHLCAKQEKVLQLESSAPPTEETEIKPCDAEPHDGEEKAENHSTAPSEDIKTVSTKDVPMQDLKAARQEVTQLLSEGEVDAASRRCEDALRQGESSEVANMLTHVALAYRDQRKFQEAEQLLQQALRIQEQCLGPKHQAVAATLNNMAAIQVELKEFSGAESSFMRTLEIWEDLEGKSHPEVALQLVNLALVLQKQGRILEAIPHLERACHINEALFQNSHPRLLHTRNALAGAYIRVLQFQEAEEQYKHVLNAVHSSGEKDDVGGTSEEKPVIWKAAEEAEETGRNKRKNREKDVPDLLPFTCLANPALNRALVDLAALYHLQGKHTAAGVLEKYITGVQPK